MRTEFCYSASPLWWSVSYPAGPRRPNQVSPLNQSRHLQDNDLNNLFSLDVSVSSGCPRWLASSSVSSFVLHILFQALAMIWHLSLGTPPLAWPALWNTIITTCCSWSIVGGIGQSFWSILEGTGLPTVCGMHRSILIAGRVEVPLWKEQHWAASTHLLTLRSPSNRLHMSWLLVPTVADTAHIPYYVMSN